MLWRKWNARTTTRTAQGKERKRSPRGRVAGIDVRTVETGRIPGEANYVRWHGGRVGGIGSPLAYCSTLTLSAPTWAGEFSRRRSACICCQSRPHNAYPLFFLRLKRGAADATTPATGHAIIVCIKRTLAAVRYSVHAQNLLSTVAKQSPRPKSKPHPHSTHPTTARLMPQYYFLPSAPPLPRTIPYWCTRTRQLTVLQVSW